MSNIFPLIPPANQLIPEDQVTRQRLSNILETTYCDHVIEDEGDIYVTDGVEIPLWIHIKSDAKLIVMVTCYDAETHISSDSVNRLNASIILPSTEGTVLWGR